MIFCIWFPVYLYHSPILVDHHCRLINKTNNNESHLKIKEPKNNKYITDEKERRKIKGRKTQNRLPGPHQPQST